MGLNSWWWQVLENYIYNVPQPPPRTRTAPMQVICVGPPRSATESLQSALLRLGYTHTHHGWDIIFEKPNRARGWVRLARRKWLGASPRLPITAADFDELLGDSVAVTDAVGSCFAGELIKAYPEAKVVINRRRDLDAWLRSMEESMLQAAENRWAMLLTWFDPTFWWVTHAYGTFLWPGLFNCLGTGTSGYVEAVRNRGKLVYEEHCDKVRGMVAPERLLEWSADEGWEPLCRFLDKAVPDEPFPYVNTKSKGWKVKEAEWGLELARPALVRLGSSLLVVAGALVGASIAYYRKHY